jgi:hypothetical protein
MDFCYSLVLEILLNFIILELLFYALYMVYDVWRLGYISWAVYVFMDLGMFYIQWHCLAKRDLWNKVYMNDWMNMKSCIYSYDPETKQQSSQWKSPVTKNKKKCGRYGVEQRTDSWLFLNEGECSPWICSS